MRIETLTREHLEGCAALLVSVFNEEPWNEHWSSETAREHLSWTLNMPGFLGFVAFEDSVMGFAAGYREPGDRGSVFYLRILCVSPHARRRGVGRKLLERMEGALEEEVRLIYLITHRNTPAQTFYENGGFRTSPEDILMLRERLKEDS